MTEASTSTTTPPGVFRSIAAGARAWRANPWSTLLTLGVLSLFWSIPWVLMESKIQEARTGFRGVLIAIGESVLWGPLLALQLRFAVLVCRGHRPTIREILDGLRGSGAFIVLLVLLMVVPVLADMLPSSPGDDVGWRDAVSIPVVTAMVVLLVRFAMSPVFIADKHLGTLEALRASWHLTKGRFWNVVGFALLQFISIVLIHEAVAGRRIAVSALFSLGPYPLWCLAYVNLYLGYAGQPRLAADGLTPAAEA